MTNAGWILMVLSWGVILGLFIFCFYNIFKERNESGDKKATH